MKTRTMLIGLLKEVAHWTLRVKRSTPWDYGISTHAISLVLACRSAGSLTMTHNLDFGASSL